MNFGVRVKELRLARALSQEKLAAKANLSVWLINSLESGRRKKPYLNTVVALATALGVSVSELIGESLTAYSQSLSAEEHELIKNWRELQSNDKYDISEFARLLRKKAALIRKG